MQYLKWKIHWRGFISRADITEEKDHCAQKTEKRLSKLKHRGRNWLSKMHEASVMWDKQLYHAYKWNLEEKQSGRGTKNIWRNNDWIFFKCYKKYKHTKSKNFNEPQEE